MMRIGSHESSENKRRWIIVRTDSYDLVGGEIIEADEESGHCIMFKEGEAKVMNFGPHGIRIIRRYPR